MSRLKQLRKSHGITQDELGEILGVQKAAVCKYETGRVPLPHEAIVKLCDHFHVTADYLLGIDGPEEAPAQLPEEPEEAQKPEEPAQEPSLTEKELTAYRRAEQTERNAAVRARRIYAQLSSLCEDARTRYMDSGEEIAALAADLSTGLSRLQDAFAEVQVIFDDAQNAFDDMQLPETAAEEPEE